MKKSTKIIMLGLWGIISAPFLYLTGKVGIENNYSSLEWLSILVPGDIRSPLDLAIYLFLIALIIFPIIVFYIAPSSHKK
jgi:hypothetical protein